MPTTNSPQDEKFIDENHRIYSSVYKPDDYTTESVQKKATGWFLSTYKIKLERLKAIAKGRRTIDIGCGSGAHLIPLLESGIDVNGIDYAPQFVEKTIQLVKESGLDANPEKRIIHGDARAMPYESGSFDFAYSLSTIPYVEDKASFMKESFRVLAPGGLAYFEFGNRNSFGYLKGTRSLDTARIHDFTIALTMEDIYNAGFEVVAIRLGQIFPMYITSSDSTGDNIVSTFLKEYMGRIISMDVTIDEAVSSSAVSCDYAYRVTTILKKPEVGRTNTKCVPSFLGGDPTKWLSQDMEFNIDKMQDNPLNYIARFARCIVADPTDCFAVYAIMKMHGIDYDEISEKYLEDVRNQYGSNLNPGQKIYAVEDDIVKNTMNQRATPATQLPGTKVSVVLPVFNGMPHLQTQIKSIQAQTMKGFELIIVNDGSTDGTKEFLDSLKMPSINFKAIHQENRKLPGALNRGFAEATGDRFTWVSADCSCRPDMLEKLSDALTKYPNTGMAYSSFFFTDNNGNITGKIERQSLLHRDLLIRNNGNASFMYTREAMKEAGIYDERFVGAEDWHYWLKMSRVFPFVYVHSPLYYYMLHEKSMQSTMRQEINQTVEKMIADFIESSGDKFDLRRLYPSILHAHEGVDRTRLIMEAQSDFSARLLSARTLFMMSMAPVIIQELINANPKGLMALKIFTHHAYLLSISSKMDEAIKAATHASSFVKGEDMKKNENVERYANALNTFLSLKDHSALSGIFPTWTSEDPELFSKDRFYIY